MNALVLTFLFLVGLVASAPALADDTLWAALRGGGHVALMRHATAPGVGDPAGFKVEDCATQRNLSAAGREQARRIGERFRARGIAAARVYSSQWCRCLDTARMLGLGEITPFAGLNSFFRDGGRESAQTAEVRALIARELASGVPAQGPLVLVTHQVNVTALSGVYPASGEIVVLRANGDVLTVVGRMRADD